MGKGDGVLVIWPAYFDADRTRSQGRIVPKGLSVESPTAEEIYEVMVRVLERATKEKIPPFRAARKMAIERIERVGRVRTILAHPPEIGQ